MGFNLDNLKKIVADDVGAQISFVTMFIDEMEGVEIPAVKNALLERNILTLTRKLHSIKSNVKFFGYSDLSMKIQESEDRLEKGEFDDKLAQNISNCLVEINSACATMKAWRMEVDKI